MLVNSLSADCTLSFKPHLTKTAAKLKNRNNLLTKLAGSSWGADADTLRSSTLALCYSVGEYFAPVWCRSAHTGLVDAQLNSMMRLISPPNRAPVASSPRQHQTTSSTKESCYRQTGGESSCSWELAATSWHLQPTTISPDITKAFVAWVGTSWHQQSMERILEVGLGGQCTPRGRPHNLTTGLCSSSTTMVSPEPFPHRTRSLRCL